MWYYNDELVLSANDLLTFLGCRFATLQHLYVARGQKTKPDLKEDLEIIQEAGLDHETAYLESLKAGGRSVTEIPVEGGLRERSEKTLEAMRAGAEVIYQAALYTHPWHGYADFLIQSDIPSQLGGYSYIPLDAKLKRTATADHLIQLGIYADLLESAQGLLPREVNIVLGNRAEVSLAASNVVYYLREAKRRLRNFLAAPDSDLKPEPCRHCGQCCWKDECEQTWVKEDHLWQVANIRKGQIIKLRDAGIKTLQQLAESDESLKVPKLAADTFKRLRTQAHLQLRNRQTGLHEYNILPNIPGRGFSRLPRPDPGDLFFDMEGDPLYPEGLEYLFGVYHRTNGETFIPFWGHDHDQEKKAFEAAMAFFMSHLDRYPNAHIYHYNHYEVTALKRLSSRYGTCEDAVDDLLRQGKLVDLYKVVREGLMVSEPGYSIKNLEAFYMRKRAGDVKNAVQSIVVYENWRHAKSPELLEEIEEYNYDDCKSTALCLDWLLALRPQDIPWFETPFEEPTDDEKSLQAREEESRLKESLAEGHEAADGKVRQLIGFLADFHRREQKPQWWKIFELHGASDEELIDDAECLGGLRRSGDPRAEKSSFVYPFTFPPQETKRRVGDRPIMAENLKSAGTIVSMDSTAGTIELKIGKKSGELPPCISLLPPQPVADKILRDAVRRFAESYAADDGRFTALKNFLLRRPPVFDSGVSIGSNRLQLIPALRDSVLFIQGPPGCGKTYHSAQVILGLLKSGKRVGVSSNSHKAIVNLLHAIEKAAKLADFTFRGAKKSDPDSPETMVRGDMIRDVARKDEIGPGDLLVGGTAWLFADPGFDGTFDYLFVDEAGQVSLANLIAMGVAARNVVLIGDQMQLSQPIQGSHPGESGSSALDYLLQGQSTVSDDRGVFLDTTWRLHPDICGFISEAVYDRRLKAHPDNMRQTLVLSVDAHPALKESGFAFIPVEHSGCSQKCEAEGEQVKSIFASLLQQRFIDRTGANRPMTAEHILVISPYNVQVNYLKSILPAGARVGTVDKFQGQEAEVVLISMSTSSAEELPRDIEFLFSRNRLNVAVSRARSLAVILASPGLLEIPCETAEQLSLVNTLCHLKFWGASIRASRPCCSSARSTPFFRAGNRPSGAGR